MAIQPLSVMIVEDEELIRAVLVERLELAGYQVFEASDAAEAIDIEKRHPTIAAVISDVHMSGEMDGIALAEWFAANAPAVCFTLTSGRVSPLEARKLLPSTRLFAKPYNVGELVQHLGDLMERNGKEHPG